MLPAATLTAQWSTNSRCRYLSFALQRGPLPSYRYRSSRLPAALQAKAGQTPPRPLAAGTIVRIDAVSKFLAHIPLNARSLSPTGGPTPQLCPRRRLYPRSLGFFFLPITVALITTGSGYYPNFRGLESLPPLPCPSPSCPPKLLPPARTHAASSRGRGKERRGALRWCKASLCVLCSLARLFARFTQRGRGSGAKPGRLGIPIWHASMQPWLRIAI